MAMVLHRWERGQASDADARHVATLCTDCGGCQDRCHLHRPLPQMLREVRQQLVDSPQIVPLEAIDGDHRTTVVLTDGRPFAAALSEALGGTPVATWRTADRLGVAAMEHPSFGAHGSAIKAQAHGRHLVVVDGGVAQALEASGVSFEWLHQAVPGLGEAVGSCVTGGERPLVCCGAAGPLAHHHPEAATRMAGVFAARMVGGRFLDARCACHLAAAGHQVTDSLDLLLDQQAALR